MTKSDAEVTREFRTAVQELARLRLLDLLVDRAEQTRDMDEFRALLRDMRKEAMEEKE